jgi:hypothetical protein
MSTPDPRFTRYLLGELAEADATALEREYFENPDVFARLVEAETALVDDYVGHRLAAAERQRFESHYLSDPRRRERVEFASALSTTIDRTPSRADMETRPVVASSVWSGWLLRLSVAGAFAVLILSIGLLWQQSRRLRADLVRSDAALSREAERTRDLQNQLASAEAKGRDLVSPLQQARPQAGGQSFVSLLLSVPAVRSPETEPAPTLTIPAGTREVRLQLAIEAAEYPHYRVAVNPVAAPAVVTRSNLLPQRSGAGARIQVTVPAERLAAGDYVLTLSGERPSRAAQDVAQLLFRVVTTPSRRSR